MHYPHKIDDQHRECKIGGGACFAFLLGSDNSHATPPPQKNIPPDEEGLLWGWCVVRGPLLRGIESMILLVTCVLIFTSWKVASDENYRCIVVAGKSPNPLPKESNVGEPLGLLLGTLRSLWARSVPDSIPENLGV